MANPFVKGWKYLMALFDSKIEENADPKVQIEQAIEDAQRQHQELSQQAAAVIGNQRQLEMQLNRRLAEVEKLQGNARQALELADQARAKGDENKAVEYENAAEAFAAKLAEHGPEGTGMFNPNMTGDIAKEQFNSGNAAYFITGPWNIEEAEAAGVDFEVEAIPSMGDQPAQPFVGVNAFFVSSESENQLAANEFVVNYLSTEAAQDALFAEGKRPPALTASFDKAASDETVKAFGEIGENGVPMPAAPEMGAVFEFWGGAEMSIIKGEGDPVQTWQKMISDIEGRIGQ